MVRLDSNIEYTNEDSSVILNFTIMLSELGIIGCGFQPIQLFDQYGYAVVQYRLED